LRNCTLIHHVHTQLISAKFIEINDENYAEYTFDDGSKVRIIIPEEIEEVDYTDDPDTGVTHYTTNPDIEDFFGFNCRKCGDEGIPLIGDIFGAVAPDPFVALPQHIEECLGLEPIETEEGNVTTIRYS